MEVILITFLRFVVPLSILRWPLLGVLVSSYLDLSDYSYLASSSFNMDYYQNWDKILDTYYLGLAAYTCLTWKEDLARKIALGSYLYRFTGVLLELLFNMRGLLFFFPNFFENFFIFYLVFKLFRKSKLLVNKQVTLIIILAILFPKLLQEYSMHLVQTPPTEIFDLSKIPSIGQYFTRPPEVYVQIGLFLVLPALALFWRLWETREPKLKTNSRSSK